MEHSPSSCMWRRCMRRTQKQQCRKLAHSTVSVWWMKTYRTGVSRTVKLRRLRVAFHMSRSTMDTSLHDPGSSNADPSITDNTVKILYCVNTVNIIWQFFKGIDRVIIPLKYATLFIYFGISFVVIYILFRNKTQGLPFRPRPFCDTSCIRYDQNLPFVSLIIPFWFDYSQMKFAML